MSRRSAINPLSVLFLIAVIAYGTYHGMIPRLRPVSGTGGDEANQPTETRPVIVGSGSSPSPDSPSDKTPQHPSAQVLAGRVTKISDGDTLELLIDQQAIRIRLSGIDAPERGQPFGDAARTHLGSLCNQQFIYTLGIGTDRYGRTIADVYRRDGWINGEMVRAGMAWHYRQFDDSSELMELQAEARTARRGLWSDPSPVPPWEWRRQRPTK